MSNSVGLNLKVQLKSKGLGLPLWSPLAGPHHCLQGRWAAPAAVRQAHIQLTRYQCWRCSLSHQRWAQGHDSIVSRYKRHWAHPSPAALHWERKIWIMRKTLIRQSVWKSKWFIAPQQNKNWIKLNTIKLSLHPSTRRVFHHFCTCSGFGIECFVIFLIKASKNEWNKTCLNDRTAGKTAPKFNTAVSLSSRVIKQSDVHLSTLPNNYFQAFELPNCPLFLQTQKACSCSLKRKPNGLNAIKCLTKSQINYFQLR